MIYSSDHKLRNGKTTIFIYVYKIFPKYAWNIYVFITYKVFYIFFYGKLLVN